MQQFFCLQLCKKRELKVRVIKSTLLRLDLSYLETDNYRQYTIYRALTLHTLRTFLAKLKSVVVNICSETHVLRFTNNNNKTPLIGINIISNTIWITKKTKIDVGVALAIKGI